MKRIYLLSLALLIAWVPFNSQAQNTTDKKDHKTVVIVKKMKNDKGEVVIEKIIGEGAEAEVILKEMALHEGEGDVNVRIITTDDDENGIGENKERLFMFKSKNGERIEGFLSDDVDVDVQVKEDLDFKFDKLYEKFDNFQWKGNNSWGHETKTNCAALGVYCNTGGEDGVRITSLIEEGGAGKSGILAEDRIVSINDEDTDNFSQLSQILSQYEPGDEVNVDYMRNGSLMTTKVILTSWKELPTMRNTWRANVTCDDNYKGDFDFIENSPEVTKRVIIIKKKAEPVVEEITEEPVVETRTYEELELDAFNVYPNPNEGRMQVSFNAEALPTVIRIVDVTGKEVYMRNLKNFDGSYNEVIDLKRNAKGTYFLTIEQNERVRTEQIVVN